ncbi:MAG: MarR family transcriptional regulator [Nitrospirae bacterium]|nr:MarR family transcriptional regulator [Nitrospirota bacterium]
MARSLSNKSAPDENSGGEGSPSALPSPHYLTVLRPLVEAYQAFLQVSDRNIASMGLTRGQFDVIVTLGRTQGLCCTDLARETLVTKGTLTGVLTRLEKKKLISRTQNPHDRRGQIICLTPEGERVFEEVFPRHINHLEAFFNRSLSCEEMDRLRPLLLKIRDGFRPPPSSRSRSRTS